MNKLFLIFTMLLYATITYSDPANSDLINRLRSVDVDGYQLAIKDMQSMSSHMRLGKDWKEALERIAKNRSQFEQAIKSGDAKTIKEVSGLLSVLDNVLLQNPLLQGKNIYAIERKVNNPRQSVGSRIGVGPSNFQNNSEIWNPAKGWKNRLVAYKKSGDKIEPTEVFKTNDGVIFSDVEPHFSGEKFMYSSIGTNGRWHLFEYDMKTKVSKQLTPEAYKDFDSFDGCYTPDGKYVFCSTGTFLGLPCTNGWNKMCGLFQYDPATGKTRQLTFDQDSNWEPVVMENGQIMYLRWEYADLPHSNSRIMFTMNPDGTLQRAYYGSGSYFPTSLFGARPIPGTNGKFVGTVSGHHSIARSGMLMIFDPAKGNMEADGVVAEIPYRGRKVQPIVRDRQNDGIWPQFLHPYPLNDKYFLVSMKYSPQSLWGIYLVDVYNNMTLIAESEEAALLEPKLMEKVKTPPVITSTLNLKSDSAVMFIQDVYFGGGLKGIPRGEVKKLRIGSFDFSPHNQGGLLGTIGLDGPWDIKRIIGEVDVESDGSVMCKIPANTPIFVQPLDAEGKALQVMRSWFTAMPGEVVSCLGCHENRNTAVPPKLTKASRKTPASIKPFYGPERGLDFENEIQPILDRACVGCHNGSRPGRPVLKKGIKLTDWTSRISGRAGTDYGGKFSESYYQLQRYVRRPGIESDMAMLTPMDVHADQTELFQLLNNGHYGVVLTDKEREMLAIWIDFNAPYFGRRKDIPNYGSALKSIELKKQYADMFGYKYKDAEVIASQPDPVEFRKTTYKQPSIGDTAKIKGWPHYNSPKINEYTANNQVGLQYYQKSIDLGDGVKLDLIKVPAGEFRMGSPKVGECPMSQQKMETPVWIGRFEITNEQYAQFDKTHNSRTEHRHGYQFGRIGYPLNDPQQPVVRISWQEAMQFCEWLSNKTGMRVTLPSEKEWEWAARAGSGTAFPFGDASADYTLYANLGDVTLREYAACTAYKHYESTRVLDNANRYDDWVPRDTVYNDMNFVSAKIGSYRPNAWDICDMNGNVWEWTRSEYLPYPYDDNTANDITKKNVKRVVRGGSWYDRPYKASSSFRMGYRDYQPVFNVGFRVVMYE